MSIHNNNNKYPLLKMTLQQLVPFAQTITATTFEDATFNIAEAVRFDGIELRGGIMRDRGIGGTHDAVRLLFASGLDIAIKKDFHSISARSPKKDRVSKIKKLISSNDIDGIIMILANIERDVASAVFDIRESPLCQNLEEFYIAEILDEQEGIEVDCETLLVDLFMPSTVDEYYIPGGNVSRSKELKKPKPREIASLFAA